MSSRTCPDWPELMELDPDLQFKHYTVAEAQLPAETLSRISHASLGDVEIWTVTSSSAALCAAGFAG